MSFKLMYRRGDTSLKNIAIERIDMEFLKEILGENYTVVETAINTYNAKPENKDKQIKLGNLASGEYVGKGKYEALETEKNNLDAQIKTLNSTITTLKNGNKDNEELQTTIKNLNKDIENLKAESERTAKTYALKEQLSKAGVQDPDYLIYKHGGIDKFNFDKDNKPIGVEESIKSYKEDKSMAYMFVQQQKPQYTPTGGGDAMLKNPWSKEHFNLTEQGKLIRDNPAQAKELAASAGITI